MLLLRLYARRDRVTAPLWIAVLGLMPALQVVSIKDLYSSPDQLARFARTTANSPALLAMYGPVFSSALGSIGTWKAGAMYAAIAIAAILTVIRHTRVEEETGRAELVGSTSVGRFAGLTAALLLTFGAATVAGIACALSLVAASLPLAGSVAWGCALAASGIGWGAVAAVAAQLSDSARTTRTIAFGALGAAFALRAVGDAGNGVLSWLSPLGWCLQVRSFADERWWVFVLLAAFATAATASAYWLRDRRDLGAGLFADRPGKPQAGPALSGLMGLAWRLQRGSMITWGVGFALYGLLIGGAVNSVSGMLGDSATIKNAVTSLGGSVDLTKSFIGYAVAMLAAAAAAFSISSVLRLAEEERSGRAELILSAASRYRHLGAHVLFAVVGPAVALGLSGLGIGVVWGATTHDLAGKVAESLAAVAVQLPAVWVVTAIALLLYGAVPRFAALAWAALSVMILVLLVGSLGTFPQYVMDLVPFVHPPKLPGASFDAVPLVWLTLIAVLIAAAGSVAFRRRDLR
ncbi:tetronasin ABC transporter integral membrane protein [Nocardia camponoti]|uniref:Tetronasin ABC transporter integral membrane protein n=2 Tax=Nocardia camponoti TaxID=1616106 RepID=A0A917V3Y3_9NOCA|nr:tetronasin ABC transporter integral membrane protein [Nocardia camponoti]